MFFSFLEIVENKIIYIYIYIYIQIYCVCCVNVPLELFNYSFNLCLLTLGLLLEENCLPRSRVLSFTLYTIILYYANALTIVSDARQLGYYYSFVT